MYADPKHLKDHVIKSRYDEETYDLVYAVCRLNGMQPSVFVRMCVEEKLSLLLEQDTEKRMSA